MISIPFELSYEDNNPLDTVEELAKSKGWAFTRPEDGLMNMTLPGQKIKYDVNMEWQEEFSALLIACTIPVEISDANYELTVQALDKINQNMWLGHFDLSNKGKYPTFRHTLMLRMIPVTTAVDTIGDIFEIAMAECNRFYMTFRLASMGDVLRIHDELDAAVFETVGEA